MLWLRKSRKLRRALEKEPDNLELYLQTAEALADEETLDEALEVLQSLLERAPLAEEAQRGLVLSGKLALLSGQAERAGELARRFPTAAGLSDQARGSALLVRAWLDCGADDLSRAPEDLAGTRALLERAAGLVASDEERREATILRARLDLACGEVRAAHEALAGLAREKHLSDRVSTLVATLRGEVLLRGDANSAEAGRLFQEVLRGARTAAESATANARIGEVYLRAGNTRVAIDRFEGALRYLGTSEGPGAAGIHGDLARCYVATGQLDPAIREAQKGIAALAPSLAAGVSAPHARLRYDLGVVLADALDRQDRWDDAAAAVKESISAETPAELWGRAHGRVVALLRRTGRVEEALGLLRGASDRLAELTPDLRLELLLERAELELLLGNAEASVEVLESATAEPGTAPDQRRTLLLGRARVRLQAVVEGVEILAGLYREYPAGSCREAAADELRAIQQMLEEDRGLRVSDRERVRLLELLGEFVPVGALERLRRALRKTRQTFLAQLDNVLRGAGAVDDDLLDSVEEVLILADIGVEATTRIMDAVRTDVRRKKIKSPGELREILKNHIAELLGRFNVRLQVGEARPHVIMVVGVNGVGKTTTIAKLAHRFKEEGKSVVLAAADTFRAGAIEQLTIWATRVGAEIVKHQAGADPAAVAYDALRAAKARNADVLIIDTAGRLHTKVNLMEELKKIRRVISRELDGAPHETLLVLDATTGQNALSQAKTFHQATEITGVVLTKLDGTAKGGIIISIVNLLNLPIKLIGIGERLHDLRDFRTDLFAEALFGDEVPVSSEPIVQQD
ncbi:MAG: signal recognition particle-docking protein FtsY [Candidatus Schekmanbacteria bacterium]|nr:signal recognition particle-docking protein FtsY [Candidatus Schekmanbacteria bacterium]